MPVFTFNPLQGELNITPNHILLGGLHSDTLAASAVQGDILYGNSTPKWARLPKPGVLSGLSHDGTDVSWVTATGSGAPVRATSPTLTTPLLGVPTSGTLTNCTGLPEGGLSLTDITTNDVSATKHGFAPKFPNNTTTFLRGDGTYAVPASSGVTSIATTSPIFGGTITGTGTISLLVNTDFLFTVGQTITSTGVGTTVGSQGLKLTNTTPATVGAQKFSPALLLTGQGWATGSSTSMATDWSIQSVPVQGSSAPNQTLVFSSQVNAGGYTSRMILTNNAGTATLALGGAATIGDNGSGGLFLAGGNAVFNSGGRLQATGGVIPGPTNPTIVCEASDILGIQSGGTATNVRFYNTRTTVTTAGEWAKFDWKTTANQFRFGTVNGTSSGTARVASWDYGGLEASPSAAITVPITSGNIVFGGGVQLSNAAVTGLTPAVLAGAINATIVLYDSTGQAYRVPCTI